MTANPVVRVLDAEPAVSPDVIEVLTQVCKLVEEDRVSSVAIAFVYRDGSCGHACSTPPSWSCLIGAITRMLHTLLRVADEE
jgi:hypothetical protein